MTTADEPGKIPMDTICKVCILVLLGANLTQGELALLL